MTYRSREYDSFQHLHSVLADEFEAVLARALEVRAWDENHISYGLAEALRASLDGHRVRDGDGTVQFSCTARKLSGKLEQSHGDIVMLLRFSGGSRAGLVGAAFLEAKKQHLKSGTYDQFRKNQLIRLLASTPHLQLLLYAHTPTSEYCQNTDIHGPLLTADLRAITVPASTALAAGVNDDGLHAFALPFSYQVVARFLRGFDLHYGDIPALEKRLDELTRPYIRLDLEITAEDETPAQGGMDARLSGGFSDEGYGDETTSFGTAF